MHISQHQTNPQTQTSPDSSLHCVSAQNNFFIVFGDFTEFIERVFEYIRTFVCVKFSDMVWHCVVWCNILEYYIGMKELQQWIHDT